MSNIWHLDIAVPSLDFLITYNVCDNLIHDVFSKSFIFDLMWSQITLRLCSMCYTFTCARNGDERNNNSMSNNIIIWSYGTVSMFKVIFIKLLPELLTHCFIKYEVAYTTYLISISFKPCTIDTPYHITTVFLIKWNT